MPPPVFAAWKKWEKENPDSFRRESLGGEGDNTFLYNRLWRAFHEGFEAGNTLYCEDTEEAVSVLKSLWETCGPWVPDDSLTPFARAVQEQLRAMLKDARLLG